MTRSKNRSNMTARIRIAMLGGGWMTAREIAMGIGLRASNMAVCSRLGHLVRNQKVVQHGDPGSIRFTLTPKGELAASMDVAAITA